MKTRKADLIVHNAEIYTTDNQFSRAEAMAVTDGKILETGPEREILNKYSAANILDAKKNPVYPGFIDAHCHFLGYGLGLQQVNVSGTASFDEAVSRIVEFSGGARGGWITGRGWDHEDWPEKVFPDRDTLDKLFPGRPVFIKRVDGHAALANGEALRRAGIGLHTTAAGGIVEVRNGRLTGILIDKAMDLVSDAIPSPSEEEKTRALLDAQVRCFAAGITTVDDAGLNKEDIELIDRLQKEGKLKMKIYAMLSDNPENFDHFLKAGPYKTERLNVRSFKFYADGALGSRGACLIGPYADAPAKGHRGLMLHHPDYFRKHAKLLFEIGFQMNTHCIGDSANRMILTIYGDVLGGPNDQRWRIEHAQVVHPDDFGLFGKYNVIPSVQPTHATSDMYWAEDRLGPERTKSAYAWKELVRQNGMAALGTDFPVEDINPVLTFFAAVYRQDGNYFPEGGLQPENALTPEEALRGMTIWAALANFEDSEKGSLEPGKAADFVILDRDIVRSQKEQIPGAKVLATFLNGEKVFSETGF